MVPFYYILLTIFPPLRSAVFVLEAIAYFGVMKASVHHSPEARRVGNLVGGIIPEVVGLPQGWGCVVRAPTCLIQAFSVEGI